jgi:hypothetical protein
MLAVPLASIYSDKSSTFVFVRDPASNDVRPVEVKIGETNETHARVASGLNPGANVLILQAGQGRELLERAGISTSEEGGLGPPRNPDKLGPAEPTAVAATPEEGKAAAANAPANGGKRRERSKGPNEDVEKATPEVKPATPAEAKPAREAAKAGTPDASKTVTAVETD